MSVPTLRLRDHRHIVFFTGAGMSAECGIPTYRGQGGIWAQYRYEEYACQRAFDRDPDKVWDFHDMRRAKVASCAPHAGHRVIAELQRDASRRVSIITQNIDGMHQRAGARDVVELHGSLWRVRCDREGIVRPDETLPMQPRRCACGAWFRPEIVWFEDPLDARNVERAEALLEDCDLLVSVGTSAVVHPAASLPRIAMARGARTVEVNLEDTPASGLYQERLRGTASEVLSALAGFRE